MNRTGFDFYGRYRVSVRGSMPETVLNACAAKGIEIREAEYSDEHCISVWIYEKDAEEFKKTVEECMCFFELEEVCGGKKAVSFVKRHKWGAAFCGLFALCLLISSLFIWEIRVAGNERISDGEIKRALEECGVYTGCFWPSINNDMVRAKMITKNPEIAWMSVNVNGSKATVPVLERKQVSEIYNDREYSDLVAARDGIAEEIYARNGRALVSRGQTVEKGDLLISGAVDSTYGRTEYVRALGEVYARTWRETTAVCPENLQQKCHTDRSRKRFAVLIGKKRINFYFGGTNTVDEYDKIIHNNVLGIDGIFSLPITIITEEILPYSHSGYSAVNAEDMKDSLLRAAEDDIDGEILSSGFVSESKDGLIKVTMRCECLENIAEEKRGERILQNDRTDS